MNSTTEINKQKFEHLMKWLSSSSSNSDESKADVASNQLPDWETMIGIYVAE
jgi:hypothetical protein